jgi:hypothetical protein
MIHKCFRILFLQGFLIHPNYNRKEDFKINSTFKWDFLIYLILLKNDKSDYIILIEIFRTSWSCGHATHNQNWDLIRESRNRSLEVSRRGHGTSYPCARGAQYTLFRPWDEDSKENKRILLQLGNIVSHSYHTYFSFPWSNLNLDCRLHDHVITRFATFGIKAWLY